MEAKTYEQEAGEGKLGQVAPKPHAGAPSHVLGAAQQDRHTDWPLGSE